MLRGGGDRGTKSGSFREIRRDVSRSQKSKERERNKSGSKTERSPTPASEMPSKPHLAP
jgi:hypothetical protein